MSGLVMPAFLRGNSISKVDENKTSITYRNNDNGDMWLYKKSKNSYNPEAHWYDPKNWELISSKGKLYQKLEANLFAHLTDSGEWDAEYAEQQIKTPIEEAKTTFPTREQAEQVANSRLAPVGGLGKHGSLDLVVVDRIHCELCETWFKEQFGVKEPAQ
ncbi:MAG: hypothetical protein ACQCN6_01695 [Candidatus Bathyarchaeia archaeon]|jgi:hypothetical protein